MPLGQMQVDGGDFEVAMAEQDLDGAQIGAGFEKAGSAARGSVRRRSGFVQVRLLSINPLR
jgi:hypothetical protein